LQLFATLCNFLQLFATFCNSFKSHGTGQD
jgi:hypothetical protein